MPETSSFEVQVQLDWRCLNRFKIGLQDVVWTYVAVVRDQGQIFVTFGLRRNWGVVDMRNSCWLLKKDFPHEVCQVMQGCIGEDGTEIKGDCGDSVKVICNDQQPALVQKGCC